MDFFPAGYVMTHVGRRGSGASHGLRGRVESEFGESRGGVELIERPSSVGDMLDRSFEADEVGAEVPCLFSHGYLRARRAVAEQGTELQAWIHGRTSAGIADVESSLSRVGALPVESLPDGVLPVGYGYAAAFSGDWRAAAVAELGAWPTYTRVAEVLRRAAVEQFPGEFNSEGGQMSDAVRVGGLASEDGFCYLNPMPEADRERAREVLGAWPLITDVLSECPEFMSLCGVGGYVFERVGVLRVHVRLGVPTADCESMLSRDDAVGGVAVVQEFVEAVLADRQNGLAVCAALPRVEASVGSRCVGIDPVPGEVTVAHSVLSSSHYDNERARHVFVAAPLGGTGVLIECPDGSAVECKGVRIGISGGKVVLLAEKPCSFEVDFAGDVSIRAVLLDEAGLQYARRELGCPDFSLSDLAESDEAVVCLFEPNCIEDVGPEAQYITDPYDFGSDVVIQRYHVERGGTLTLGAFGCWYALRAYREACYVGRPLSVNSDIALLDDDAVVVVGVGVDLNQVGELGPIDKGWSVRVHRPQVGGDLFPLCRATGLEWP